MKKIKIEWCEWRKRFIVMEGGLPFRQIYDDTDRTKCEIILRAYVEVGYEDVTGTD